MVAGLCCYSLTSLWCRNPGITSNNGESRGRAASVWRPGGPRRILAKVSGCREDLEMDNSEGQNGSFAIVSSR